ncbi:hypothetical protein RU07_12240 [Agrobacterium tumefaciens]|uniref:Uncharacterized protein n=1 Tax=Agrobacterium tumefaciens TaxID=358 RepID=A0A0D0KV68_AGRTU|nr:hypothetical protein RU07_12240 [Agrobacterium tumefaciens]
MTDNLDIIAQKIDTLAKAELSAGQPYLLSKLGADLGSDIKVIKESGLSLTQFIQEKLSKEYSLIYTGIHRNIQSLIFAESPKDLTALPSSKETKPKAQRFHYRFWAAFSVPSTDKRRFLNSETFTFLDEVTQPVGPYVEIERDYIAERNIENRDEKINENIIRWITDKGLELDHFLANNYVKSSKANPGVPKQTLLHEFLAVLNDQQLATINLPLQVVAAMLKKTL